MQLHHKLLTCETIARLCSSYRDKSATVACSSWQAALISALSCSKRATSFSKTPLLSLAVGTTDVRLGDSGP